MTKQLTKIFDADEAARSLSRIAEAHSEWLYVREGRSPVALRRSEMDFHVEHARVIFYCLNDEGTQIWRVTAWIWTGEKLLLEAVRRMGQECATIELIPRTKASALAEEVLMMRRARLSRLAALIKAQLPGTTIERASLSQTRFNQPGSFARIILKQRRDTLLATGLVTRLSERKSIDALLSHTLLSFEHLKESGRARQNMKLCIAVEKPYVEALCARTALLRDDIRHACTIYEIDEDWLSLKEIRRPSLEELFATRPPRIVVCRTEQSDTSARIKSIAPDAIDVVRSRHGETLRFHGLSFARVRRVLNHERVWFGLDSSKRLLLGDDTREEWERLLSELMEHRRARAATPHHALYKQSAESWLESILRRDIRRLDTGLRLAPLHAQFRAALGKKGSSRPLDLLALRQDGRLVVIELKVSEDREHLLQAADYWRRIETYRRHGTINRAHLFDDAQIADEPPLVYLVAPMLSFHRAFNRLAQTLRREIELYRLDLNEDWRAGVQVIRRVRVN